MNPIFNHSMSGTPTKTMQMISTMPHEIQIMILDEVKDKAGPVFLDSLILSAKVMDRISDKVIESDICKTITYTLEMDHLVSQQKVLDDDFVNAMGPGYCYLIGIKPEARVSALPKIGAWPTLQTVFSMLEHSLDDRFSIIKEEPYEGFSTLHLLKLQDGYPPPESILFHSQCNNCHAVSQQRFWSKSPYIPHAKNCNWFWVDLVCTPDDEELLHMYVGGIFNRMMSNGNKQNNTSKHRKSRSITDSKAHEDKQVLKFSKSIKGDGIEPDMSRDLFSVPKPTEIETMADHLNNHKSGDIFPYVSVVGNEEETKDGRLSRLRAFRSAYGKENKPEMRINGVILDELEGTIMVKHIGEYVNQDRLSKSQRAENKKFRPIDEASFKKPYIQISRITGEFVPLMSSTADYTELYFTLEDGRLLDNQVIVQSNKLPTNQNGVFELSCDYCVNLKDIDQLSLKYFLSRPIMKEGFQWGAVSLTIRISEADTPYLTPKVEAMAIARIPYTTLEDQSKDPDHADVVYTAKQVEKFKELYRAGDVMDIDEAKRERTKMNSYSKSTIRGATKGEAGPSHLGNQSGWEHLKGMIKPRIDEGLASVSAASDPDEDDIDVPLTTREEYERQQEKMRLQFQSPLSDTTEEISDSDIQRSSSPAMGEQMPSIEQVTPPRPAIKSAMKKPRFSDEGLKKPSTEDVYRFD